MEPGGLGLFDLNLQVEQRLNCLMFDGLKVDCMELGELGQDGLNLLGMVLAGWVLDCQMTGGRELGRQELDDQMQKTFHYYSLES